MDSEFILRQFQEIEEKVGKVIELCKSQETINLELRNRIKILEEEIQEKVEAENNYVAEKGLIRSKVDSILAKLEEIK
ncbi:MAG: hypothetical protein JRJ39_04900 [Deltaproteobacteria bacterium]|nr:hypothetical protein [Deltaproteobacteria bacterium]MBW1846616.1 hypothetical protein [Deltaproteobacteria bacterium]MBW2179202.1 hypothetical protein [Deltaproteobacteria bacterium]